MKKIFNKKILKTLLLWFLFIVTLTVGQGCVSSKEKAPTIKRVAAGEMLVPRWAHDAVLLKDGRVLIIGGSSKGTYQMHAEIYDPKTKKSTEVKSKMFLNNTFTELNAKGFLLDSGKVLLVSKDLLQIFDPETETFTKIDVDLPSDQIAGLGINVITELGEDQFFMASSSYSYVFNAKDNSFKIMEFDLPDKPDIAKNIRGKRILPDVCSIVKIKNGNLIITGGSVRTTSGQILSKKTDEIIELDINSGKTRSVGTLTVPRSGHNSFLLSDGNILIAGGGLTIEPTHNPELIPVEIYNVETQKSQVVGYIPYTRFRFILVGDNLIAIGNRKIDIYNINTNKLYMTNTDTKRYAGQSITIIDNKIILMTGGFPTIYSACIKNIDLFYLK